MDKDEFGRRLKELRAAKAQKLGRRKIPQREVAAALSISPGAYSNWESARTQPDVSLLPYLADYFEVSLDFLLGHTVPVQSKVEYVKAENGLAWSIRRPVQTENERQGLEAWRRFTQGEALGEITAALQVHSLHQIERFLQDVFYTDLISIDYLPQEPDLAKKLKQTFKLREVVVVPILAEAPALLRNILLGEAARAYFKKHVYDGMKIGLAGGYSVSRMIYSLRRGECRSIEVYPLGISPVIEAISLDANSLVGAMVYRHDGYNVRGYALQYASPSDWEKSQDIQHFAPTLRILARAKSVDIAFMSIGVIGRRRAPVDLLGDLLETRGLDLQKIRERGAIGDILYHLVNQDGQLVCPEISNLICSISLADLREICRSGAQVVVIASRREKEKIARATITAGYANVFIIDDELARALLGSEVG